MSRRPNISYNIFHHRACCAGRDAHPHPPFTDPCCALARAGLEALHPNLNPAGWTLSTLTLAWVAYPAFNTAFRRLPTSRPGER